MNIEVIKGAGGKWVASCEFEGDKFVYAHVRVGCAVREILNAIQYKYGPPDGNLVSITVEGW